MKQLVGNTMMCGAIALNLSAGPARAEVPLTTGGYRAVCSETDAASVAFCRGYAQAVIDFAQASGSACVPEDTTSLQVMYAIEGLTFDKIGTEGFPATQKAVSMAIAVVNRLFACNR